VITHTKLSYLVDTAIKIAEKVEALLIRVVNLLVLIMTLQKSSW
jgi:hypothetical protein